MRIKIEAELSGTEIIDTMTGKLAASDAKISAEPKEIKAQVQIKSGEWVEVTPDKIKFSYTSQGK